MERKEAIKRPYNRYSGIEEPLNNILSELKKVNEKLEKKEVELKDSSSNYNSGEVKGIKEERTNWVKRKRLLKVFLFVAIFLVLSGFGGYWIKHIFEDKEVKPMTICPFVNSLDTLESDNFDRADNATGCGSTMKDTPYINNVRGKIESYMEVVTGGGGAASPCELPTITVTGGNLSYQFNITLNGSTADLREIDFDAGDLGQLWFYRNGNSGICWANSVPAVQCSTNLVAVNDKYTIRINIDTTNSKWTGYWYNTSANTLVETFGETWETFTVGGFGGQHSTNKDWALDDFMMWNSTALGGGTCPGE